MMLRLLCCLLLMSLIQQQSFSQKKVSDATSNEMYRQIEEQIQDLFRQRGLSDNEILPILNEYKSNNIISNEQLAGLLYKLYPSNSGIGILLFFFSNDTLQRIFLTPGRVIEHKIIPIDKKSLFAITDNTIAALRLFKKTKNRFPQKRGIIIDETPANKTPDLNDAIKKAGKILLPEFFNNTFRNLLIIPALNIGTFPFALLKPYGNNQQLLDQCCYTIVPSLVDLIILRTKVLKDKGFNIDMYRAFDTVVNKRLLQIKFSFEKGLFISNPAYPANTDYIFPNLPGTQREVEVARSFVAQSKILDGSKAVKDSVFRYMRQSDILYFATHGIADETEPMEKSFLVLSGVDPFLRAREIMQFRRTDSLLMGFPEVVVLSACQTGLGKAIEAGIVGLARSFLLAGSHHVIMSLWNVDDNATAYLMNRFIYYMGKPSFFSPSEPLRRAMLDTKKKYPDPAMWASFSLFGIDY